MKKRSIQNHVLVAMMLAAAVWSAPAAAQSSGVTRPIQGAASGTVVNQIPPNGLQISYTGLASHLGKFTRDETLFLNPDGSFVGQFVFHAANGDQLHARLAGQFISPRTAVGQYIFAGGTGRFENATGIANFEAVTPDGLHVTIKFAGNINY